MSRHGGYEDLRELPYCYDHAPPYVARGDVGFYVEMCRQAPGGVLELGCGTGRVLIPAARAGGRITGLDYSEHMLARGRQKLASLPQEVQQRVTLVQGNMTSFDLGRQFALVTIPFRPFQHLITIEEQLACLRAVHRHLLPGGQLVFDVFQVDPARISGPVNPEEIEDISEFELPDGRWMRRTFRITAMRRAEQCNDVELIYYVREPGGETRRIVQAFPFRYFYRSEVEQLLARAGFRVVALYGGFDRSPFMDSSADMIFLAEKT